MYLDTFGGPARVQESASLAAPLRLASAFESKEMMPNALSDGRTAIAYGPSELLAIGDAGILWRIDGDFSGGVRHSRGLLVAVRTLDGARFWTTLDPVDGAEMSRQSTDHTLDALVEGVAVGRRTSRDPDCFDVSMEASQVDGASRRRLWMQVSAGAYDENFSKLFACSPDGIFLAKGRRIVALNLGDGTERWTSEVSDLGGPVSLEAHPMVAEDVCVVATKHWTAGFAVETGHRLWSTPVWGPHVVYGRRVYVIQDGTFHVFDLLDGSLKAKRDIGPEIEKKGKRRFDRISTHIAASDEHIWGGDPYGTLWALSRETGRPEWHHRPKGTTGYSGAVPAISASRLYIPSFSMDPRSPPSLYCYEQE